MDEEAPRPVGRRYRRAAWVGGVAAFAASMTLYVLTVAPSVTLGFAGYMTAAADDLGIANPPGYPLWVVLGWGWIRIAEWLGLTANPGGPAYAMNLFSAFFGALAAGLLAGLITGTARRVFRDRVTPLIAGVGGFAASLLFAFGGIVWFVSVVAHAHTLNLFLLVAVLLLAARWLNQGDPDRRGSLVLSFFLVGCLAANSRLLVILAPFALAVFALGSRAAAKAVLGVSAAGGLALAAWLGSPFPHPFPLLIAAVLGAAGMTLIVQVRHGRLLLGCLLAAAAGLAWLAFPILASHLGAEVQWVNAAEPEYWLHLIAQGQYETIDVVGNLAAAWHDPAWRQELVKGFGILLDRQYLWPFWIPAGLGLVLAAVRGGWYRWQTALLVLLLLTGPLLYAGVIAPGTDLQTLLFAGPHLLPLFPVVAIYLGYGFMALLSLRALWSKTA